MPNTSQQTQDAASETLAVPTRVDSLFPLRMTAFEFYYLLEHRPDYPSVFPIRLEGQGDIDRAAFERAYAQAHSRHPLLSARVNPRGSGIPEWIAGMPTPITWHTGPATQTVTSHTAFTTPGVEADVYQTGDKFVLTFVFFHVATDGMGAFQFLTDLLAAYVHECSGMEGTPRWRTLDRNLLRDRDGHSVFKHRMRLRDLLKVGGISIPLMVRRAAVVREHKPRTIPATTPTGPAEFLLHTLTQPETAKLSRIARKLEVRLHDLLLRDYILMLDKWNRGTPEAKRALRICVPTNLRRKQDYRMPAANVFSYAFLSRRERDCQHRAELLESVRAEMAAIKRSKRGLYYEAGLKLFSIWPAVLRNSLKREWPFATAVFTNLGASFDHIPLPWVDGRRMAGDLALDNGYGAGPIRPETRISLAVHTYAGRMSIALQCDQRCFGAAEQQALLQAYLDQLSVTRECET